MQWNEARGWLDRPDADKLAELASGKRVVEFGSYCGRSALAMARTASFVLCLDWFGGDAGTGPGDVLGEFLANTRHWPNIMALVGRFEETVPRLVGQFDMAYVDGAHDYASAKRDTEWAMRLVPSGVIAWHDWNTEEVKAAVADCGLSGGETVGNVRWIVRTS